MFKHIPVMKKEIIHYLNIVKNGIYIDGTFGSGGHSKEILLKLNKDGKLIVFDKDINSIKIAKNIFDKRLIYKHCSFSKIKNFIKKKKLIGKINGIVLDLGLSTDQILDYKRGFSFMKNGILDMRMNIHEGIPAFKWLKNAHYKEIEYIFKNFGEEYKYSKKIAKAIYYENKKKLIKYSNQLVSIINKIHKRKSKINISTKYFQAIRIFINNELNEIKNFLFDVISLLNENGRIVIISFNSLETRIIKNYFNKKNLDIISVPLTLKEEMLLNNNTNNKFYIKKIKKIKPTKEEIIFNKKSRSAIMHVFEKKKNIL